MKTRWVFKPQRLLASNKALSADAKDRAAEAQRSDPNKSDSSIDIYRQCSYTVRMAKIGFEWNPAKSKDNLKKHGVAFEEATTVFFDDRAIEFYDDSHSDWEDRMLLLGLSTNLRLLLVCHCYRESDSVIRIISARKATKNESKLYHR